jgi:hypothetical protein
MQQSSKYRFVTTSVNISKRGLGALKKEEKRRKK